MIVILVWLMSILVELKGLTLRASTYRRSIRWRQSSTSVGFEVCSTDAEMGNLELEMGAEEDHIGMKMRAMLWDELREGKDLVTQEALKQWDDISDFYERGIMDDFTVDAILREVGISNKNQGLTQSQLFEAIDLTNHVGMALAAELDEAEEDTVDSGLL